METNINYAAVGAFMIALIAAIVLSIIWLSSGFSTQHYQIYKVYMQESVSGLNVDSPVEFNGVNVGNVKSISLDLNNPQLVSVLLDIQASTPITRGTVATLQTRGVTGITFMALKDKSENLTKLTVMKGESYPVIPTSPSIFMRLDIMLSKLSDNLHDVSVSIRELLNPENQQSIKDILLNMKNVTAMLADNNQKMVRILANTEKFSTELVPLMRNTSNAMRMFETQTMPATYRLLSNLDTIARSLTEVTSEMKQNPSVLLRGVQRQPYGPGDSR
ncbi:MAG TPA: MlaD family protein [Gammaproteobacteria bacterium]|jgi:phospholipid/cholesterol/gamma-HCH transport system substrate-binding protein|nr:MlaD family protein [Gammaproteobacteria bacterium]